MAAGANFPPPPNPNAGANGGADNALAAALEKFRETMEQVRRSTAAVASSGARSWQNAPGWAGGFTSAPLPRNVAYSSGPTQPGRSLDTGEKVPPWADLLRQRERRESFRDFSERMAVAYGPKGPERAKARQGAEPRSSGLISSSSAAVFARMSGEFSRFTDRLGKASQYLGAWKAAGGPAISSSLGGHLPPWVGSAASLGVGAFAKLGAARGSLFSALGSPRFSGVASAGVNAFANFGGFVGNGVGGSILGGYRFANAFRRHPGRAARVARRSFKNAFKRLMSSTAANYAKGQTAGIRARFAGISAASRVAAKNARWAVAAAKAHPRMMAGVAASFAAKGIGAAIGRGAQIAAVAGAAGKKVFGSAEKAFDVAKGIHDLGLDLRRYAEKMAASASKIAPFSPSTGFQLASNQFHGAHRAFAFARNTEATTVGLLKSVDRLRDSWAEYDSATQNIRNRFGSIAANASSVIGPAAGFVAQVADSGLKSALGNGDFLREFSADIGKQIRDSLREGLAEVTAGIKAAFGVDLGHLAAAPAAAPAGMLPADEFAVRMARHDPAFAVHVRRPPPQDRFLGEGNGANVMAARLLPVVVRPPGAVGP